MSIKSVNKKSEEYPPRLLNLHQPPTEYNFIGEDINELLQSPTLGIVGSRKVSSYGRTVTENLTSEAARAGVCIVSGLALGVDSIAHAAAVKVQGKTIAVLPSGLRAIYPASHRGLARNIVSSGGTLISEYDSDFRPRRESFIQRNRIIAGLSDALLITEAAEKSGSLHTARFALELGLSVLAVPGNVNSPTSVGTNNLIKSGAVMVSSIEDIFEALNIQPAKNQQLQLHGDNEEETLLIKFIQTGITSGEELLSTSELETIQFQQTLTMLEIKGIISPLGNNHWRLK